MELYKPPEVAQILRVSVRTVQRLRANGDIEFYLIKNKPRYSKQQVEKYIESTKPQESYVKAIINNSTAAQYESDIIAAKQRGRELAKKLFKPIREVTK